MNRFKSLAYTVGFNYIKSIDSGVDIGVRQVQDLYSILNDYACKISWKGDKHFDTVVDNHSVTVDAVDKTTFHLSASSLV